MASPAPTAPRTRRNRLRLVASAALGVAVGALMLSGCVAVKTYAQQQGSIGAIDIVVTGCGSKANTPGCGLGNSGLESNTTGTGRCSWACRSTPGSCPRRPSRRNSRRSAALHGEPVLHGRADAALAARRRAQVGRLHLGRPHVHAGQAGHGARADHPPRPARRVSQRVRFGFNWVIGSRGVIEPDAPATRAVACGDDLTATSIRPTSRSARTRSGRSARPASTTSHS